MNTPKEPKIVDAIADDPAIRELIPGYLKRRLTDIATVTELLTHDKFDDIRILAHNMHGSGAAYGIARISEIGRDMEKAAQDLDGEGVAQGLDALRDFLENVAAD